MKLRPLMIGPEETAKVKRVVEFAEKSENYYGFDFHKQRTVLPANDPNYIVDLQTFSKTS